MKNIKKFDQFINEGKDLTENDKLAKQYPTIKDLPYKQGDKVEVLNNGEPTGQCGEVSAICTTDNPKYPETIIFLHDGNGSISGLYNIDFKLVNGLSEKMKISAQTIGLDLTKNKPTKIDQHTYERYFKENNSDKCFTEDDLRLAFESGAEVYYDDNDGRYNMNTGEGSLVDKYFKKFLISLKFDKMPNNLKDQ